MLVGRRADVLDTTAAELRHAGGEVTTHSADLRSPAEVAALAAAIVAGGPVHVLVLNAGGNQRAYEDADEPADAADPAGRRLPGRLRRQRHHHRPARGGAAVRTFPGRVVG